MAKVFHLPDGELPPSEPPFVLITNRASIGSPEWTISWRYRLEGRVTGGAWGLPCRSEENAIEIARQVAAEKGIAQILVRKT